MKNICKLSVLSLFLSQSILLSGCATLNRSSVVASNELPEGSKVEVVQIPRDPSLPKFLVVVEPFNMDSNATVVESASEGSGHCTIGNCKASYAYENRSSTTVKTVGHGVSSQLTTALTNAGNIQVLDTAAAKKNRDGTYTAKLGKGEKGPYIIRGTVTEFTEDADTSGESSGGSLGWLGAVGGIAGAVTGNRGLLWTGAGLAAANPTLKAEEKSRIGMIAFDVQIVDGKTGRIVKGFNVAGTFTSKSASNGFSLFGIGNKKHEFAQSVLGQAMRVAMNDAVKKTFETLKNI